MFIQDCPICEPSELLAGFNVNLDEMDATWQIGNTPVSSPSYSSSSTAQTSPGSVVDAYPAQSPASSVPTSPASSVATSPAPSVPTSPAPSMLSLQSFSPTHTSAYPTSPSHNPSSPAYRPGPAARRPVSVSPQYSPTLPDSGQSTPVTPFPGQCSQSSSVQCHSPVFNPDTRNYMPSSRFGADSVSPGISGTASHNLRVHTYPSPVDGCVFAACPNQTPPTGTSAASTPKSAASSQQSVASPFFPEVDRFFDSPDLFGVERLPFVLRSGSQSQETPPDVVSNLSQSSVDSIEEAASLSTQYSMPVVAACPDDPTRGPWPLSQESSDAGSAFNSQSPFEYGPTPLGCGMGYSDSTQ